MNPIGAVFQPELIELMKAVLDDATAMLPEAKRTSTTFDEARADFASAYRDPGRVVAREGALPHRSEDRKRQKRPLYAI